MNHDECLSGYAGTMRMLGIDIYIADVPDHRCNYFRTGRQVCGSHNREFYGHPTKEQFAKWRETGFMHDKHEELA